ncbi:MAG TPA: hypothetical protein VFC37_21725 [Terracidiphilus sp.]|nr:hypothetical protein [Terracidiphilus sp.]
MHPESEGKPKKVWTTPNITKIDLKSAPCSDIIDILRATLKQAEKDASLNPNDQKAAELERSLRRKLDDLESSRPTVPREDRSLSLMPKHFVVFAERFEHGAWKYWEHECDKEEIPALEDSATAKAFSRTPSSQPLYIDYFRGAEYLFNVVHGRSGPAEGDTRVFGIRVDKILIAECERFTQYLVCSLL